jgi:predicted RNA-binding Zn-ribbon protein involved in translation (DUF1610 family)
VAKTCIKCGYARRDTETAPDYECPACGVVYAKAEAAQAAARSRAVPTAAPRHPAPMEQPQPQARAAADALAHQLLAQGPRRTPPAYRGLAMVALLAFALGFASAAGLYASAEKLRKKATAQAVERCPR